MGEQVGGLLSRRTSPGSHRHPVRGRQGGLAEGCWGVLAEAGAPRRWEGEGASTIRCPNEPCLPGGPPPARPQLRWVRQQPHVQLGRRRLGHLCGLDDAHAFSMFTFHRRASSCAGQARCRPQGCLLLLGDNVRGQKSTTHSLMVSLARTAPSASVDPF